MAIDIQGVRKVLELEKERGYNNRVVIGGLEEYIRRWAIKVQERLNQPHLLYRFEELKLIEANYSLWDKEKRKQWIEEVLSFLTEIEKAQSSPITAPPPKKTLRIKSLPKAPSLSSPISEIRGIGKSMASKLARLGVKTVRDLLYFFPRRYLDYSRIKTISQLEEGEEATIKAFVWEAREVALGSRMGTEAIVGDETGNIRVVWFNQPYLAKRFSPNDWLVLSGKVRVFKGRKVLESPEWEFYESGELIHTGRLVPIYPLTEGLHPRQLRRLMKEIVEEWSGLIIDFLPPEIKERRGLLDLKEAIRQAHFPENEIVMEAARKRLAFDELFLFQLGLMNHKRQWQSGLGHSLKYHPSIDRFINSLPFPLTSAQKRVLDEIISDLEKSYPMSRLLQGEVGSGKTVVATIALLLAVANERQGAFMAPTEILAEQHFATIAQLFSAVGKCEGEGFLRTYTGILPRPITLALLIGSLKPSLKEEIHNLLKEGKVDLVVGTHALIQKAVEFSSLGLAVIDEQHRFGVLQRAELRRKGFNPHVLVMTATPIPRSLALTIYGDLDLSVLDELPPGRQRVRTRWLEPEEREWAYQFIRKEIEEGGQAFIICPIIEESEVLEVRAAVEEYNRLSREVFPDLRIGLLHGRMSIADKEEVMRRFRSGELNILVSTPVVEVGIDVPNATVMLIEGAERFGLAQLHQFRGRVGRGEKEGFCFLLAETLTPEARERLSLIEKVHNGFILAEEDLRMRGPGEFLGTRQSGMPDLKMAKLSDLPLLEMAREEARKLFEKDPLLKEHKLLKEELERMFKDGGEWS